MKSRLTQTDVKIMMALVLIMLLKSVYQLYFFETNRIRKRDIRQLFKWDKYPVFHTINWVSSVAFISSATYFALNGKIQSPLFAILCLYMVWRSVSFFAAVQNIHIPFIYADEYAYAKFTYYNIRITSLITFLFMAYLLKLVLY